MAKLTKFDGLGDASVSLSAQCNAWHWTDIKSLKCLSVCLSICPYVRSTKWSR